MNLKVNVPINIIQINSISELLVLKQVWNKYFSCAFMASQYNKSHIEIWGWLFTNFLTHLLCYLWSFDKHFNLSSGLALVYNLFFFLLNIILIDCVLCTKVYSILIQFSLNNGQHKWDQFMTPKSTIWKLQASKHYKMLELDFQLM